MLRKKLSKCFLSLLFVFLFLPELKAQKPKIAIVFCADTTLICQHIGYTIFSNSTNSLPLDINIPQYLTEKLEDNLSGKYEVENIFLPDSLQNVKLGFFESGISKKLKEWAASKKNDYDKILFISNGEVPSGRNLIIPQNTSGIYSKAREAYLYTTINLNIYDISAKKMVYQGSISGGDWFPKLYGIKLPKNKKAFDDLLLQTLTEQFKNLLDQRIDYYLSKSKLLLNSSSSDRVDPYSTKNNQEFIY